ncbi:MAG TPA: VWA domain-containing protein, partial [Pyrinomonadaceae bacterium]|nr:VWA domain-containing protein [Pyrinomonadaceae bacterium]
DDLHLSPDSLGRTRAALTRFVEDEMTPGDAVAFVTASGQLGFLQQFTSSRAPLRAAAGRLRHIPYPVRDIDQPPMTEYVAIRIQNGDREAASFYVDKMLESYATRKNERNINRNAVFEMVRNRANQLVLALEAVTDGTLTSLDKFLRSAGHVPGRKLVFFISDGFYLDSKNSGSGTSENLRRVTDTATRTGSVLYTIDARGLFSGQAGAANERPFDPTGRVDRASVGESSVSQGGLSALAEDTGGRFLSNQNYFDRWVSRNLEETSDYYVLAWRPATEAQKGGKFRRVEVSVVGRPDLTVRAPRGYVAGAAVAAEAKADAKAAPRAPEDEMREALTAAAPKRSLPTAVSASFVDVPGTGPVLTGSVQVSTEQLDYGADGKQPAGVDVVGVVFNDQGKQAANFKTRLNVAPLAPGAGGQGVIYNHRAPLAPGLYQVRAAARDTRGGLVGSASEWIEIPDLSKRQLTLSSLHLGGRAVGGGAAQADKGAAQQVQFSVDHKFARSSRLDFLVIAYNAARAAVAPVDLTAQVKIYSNGRAIVSSTPGKLPAGDDPAHVPFAGSLPLSQLPAGLYEMEVIVTDNVSKTTATQRAAFEIQ